MSRDCPTRNEEKALMMRSSTAHFGRIDQMALPDTLPASNAAMGVLLGTTSKVKVGIHVCKHRRLFTAERRAYHSYGRGHVRLDESQ